MHLLQDKYENGHIVLLRICKDGIFPLFTPGPGRFGPDRPEGEISPSNGDIGWGVP